MASTATVINTPSVAHGTFTSVETTAVDEVVTVGFDPKFVIVLLDANSATPDVYIGYNDSGVTETVSILDTGAGATDIASAELASGIHFSGRTFTIESGIQTADGVNYYLVVG